MTALLIATPTNAPSQASADDPPLVVLRVAHLASAHVSYLIRIDPHRDNIWFCFGWDNRTTAKSRTSCQQLNGIFSPRVVYQEYKALEAGCYQGFVDVYRAPYYRAGSAVYLFRIGDKPCAH